MHCFVIFVIAVCILFLFKQRLTRFIPLTNSKQLKFRTLALLFSPTKPACPENAKLQLSFATGIFLFFLLLRGLQYSRAIQSNSSAIEPNRTPIVRLPNSIEHNRTHNNKFCQSNTIERSINERLVIEPNRTFDY